MRLAIYLFRRWRQHGPDRRYVARLRNAPNRGSADDWRERQADAGAPPPTQSSGLRRLHRTNERIRPHAPKAGLSRSRLDVTCRHTRPVPGAGPRNAKSVVPVFGEDANHRRRRVVEQCWSLGVRDSCHLHIAAARRARLAAVDSFNVRPLVDGDWPAIAALANVAVDHVAEAPSQQEWSENRRRFTGCRRHHVAVRDGTVVGYGAIERAPRDLPHSFRLFLALDWTNPVGVAGTLVEHLERDLLELEATTVWLREYASDRPFLDFLTQRGFTVSDPYELGGQHMVNLHRRTNLSPRITHTTSFSATDQAALGLDDPDAFGIEHFDLEWRRKDDHFIWYDDGGPIAHVGLVDHIIAESADGITHEVLGVGSVVTRPDRRRQGYSQRLLAHALANAKDSSTSRLAMLFCRTELVGFYAHQGWQAIEAPVRARKGNGAIESPLHLMCKSLAADAAVPTIGADITVHERHW